MMGGGRGYNDHSTLHFYVEINKDKGSNDWQQTLECTAVDPRRSSTQLAQARQGTCRASTPVKGFKVARAKRSKCSKQSAGWLPNVSENCATIIKNSSITEVCSILNAP